MNDSGKHSNPARLALVVGLVVIWSLAIISRLGYLQFFKHGEYTQKALQRQQYTRSLLAPRGVIYDSHMDELATSVNVGTVVAEPRRIENIQAAAKNLASILGLRTRELVAKMTDPARETYMVVKRRIDPEAENRITGLGMEGVYLIEESMRVYPNRELACQTLGFVNMNGDGGAGLELEYDKELKGTEGQISFDVDAHRKSFRGTVEKAPRQGRSLVLSIDKSIQYLTARELAAGVEKYKARSGVAVVMESDTGRILALANYPEFNCNTYNEYEADLWRNRAVSDLFEPGSTFKVVVATAALEAGLTRPGEIIDCQMGSITIGRHIFHDHKPFGLLSFNQILEQSSNVGAAKLGLRLGEQRLYEALRTFGFGSRTQIDLPGEIVGLVRDWHEWSALSIGAISFGQEVGVTSVQILTAINAIANGGYRVRPSLVDRVLDSDSHLIRVRTPERTLIMRPETAAEVSLAFEGVVLRGTGKSAALEGYRAAGKTGTAQKIVDGHYSSTKYVSSFIGFAPLPRPRITVLVQIDEPRGSIYGGTVSAPVFQKITQETLLQLKVPPDRTLPLPKLNPALAEAGAEDFIPNGTPLPPLGALQGNEPGLSRGDAIRIPVAADTVELPDFRGMAKREVLDRCTELRIQLQASGSGIAIRQQPPPGTRIPVGDFCSVTFARGGIAGLPRLPEASSALVTGRPLASQQASLTRH
jgi:cell division protein FtsI (penicillin-binding protein 3)